MNWKLRFKNRTVLAALIAAVIAFIYQILGIVGITPSITQDTVTQLVGLVLNVLVGLGVIIDPTTPGVGDSELAKSKADLGETIIYEDIPDEMEG